MGDKEQEDETKAHEKNEKTECVCVNERKRKR